MVRLISMGFSENYITKKVMDHLKVLKKNSSGDFFFQKVSDKFTSGVPDVYILYRGHTLWIELKASGEAPRPLQSHTIQQLRQSGADAQWFDDHSQAIDFIDDFVEKRNRATQFIKL